MALAMQILLIGLVLVALGMVVFVATRYPKPAGERGGAMSVVAVAVGLLVIPVVIAVYYWAVTWDV